MNDDVVRRYWEANAEGWTRLSRAGYDVYRDNVNTPAFLSMLPSVAGLHGLDVGCGEGHNTRLLARRGARMTAVDIAPTFVRSVSDEERREPLGVDVHEASALALPFADGAFDFVTAFMSLMDVAEPERALAEASRVLRPGGFFQFSITHPCFQTAKWEWVLDDNGERTAMICGDYFRRLEGAIEEWTFGSAPEEVRRDLPPFRIPRFTRTLSDWLNAILDCGLRIEAVAEPRADAEALQRHPRLADSHIVAYFLIVRARKAA